MEDEINLLDYWKVILKWKKTIIAIIFIISSVSVIISLFLPKIYRAEASLMPVGGQKGSSLASMAAQAGLGGLLGGTGGGSSSLQLLAIFKSKTLAEKMIEKYDLMKVFFPKAESGKRKAESENHDELTAIPSPLSPSPKGPTMEDAVNGLFSQITFSEDKKAMMISVNAEMEDPQLAARLVNGYIEELANYLKSNAFTVAKRNRIFIEEQLERNKTELLESGKELTAFYSSNKISNITPTVDVNVAMGSGKMEVESGKLEKEVESLKLKVESAKNLVNGRAFVESKVVKDVPQQVYLQYLTLRRDLLGQVNSLLTQQYEMAKIDEMKEDLNFQVIDWARVPTRKCKPKRAQIVMTAFVLSLFSAVFYAFFREYLEKMKSQSQSS